MIKDQAYYESLDKRTKEYKQYANRSKGLGDDIKKVLDKTGVTKVVDAITKGKDCGCNERKEKLNDLFPRSVKAVRCMTDDQLILYKNYRESRTLNIWYTEDIKFLTELYRWVFAISYNPKDFCLNCQGTAVKLLKITKHLDSVYESYENI